MTRKEINEMIAKALLTESRRRKADYQTELEALGYEISKYDGAWRIKNTLTGRKISRCYNNDYINTLYNSIKFGNVWSRKYHKYVYKPMMVIDFVGLLEKPLRENHYWDRTNYEIMKDALWEKRCSEKRLNNAMDEYTKKIEEITERYKHDLESAKNSYDWNIKYNTDKLNNANKTISELLTR